MLIRNRKAFNRGLLLLITFLIVFVIFFMPVFPPQEGGGAKTNGLVFADHLFNTLSKGSSNFFDPSLKNEESVNKTALETKGVKVALDVPFKDAKQIPLASALLNEAGFTVSPSGSVLKIQGELYPLLERVLEDGLSTYNNAIEEVSKRHNGADGRGVMKAWWHLLSGMVQPMQKMGQNAEATVVKIIVSKAIEPSYNFYGITPLHVGENIPLVAGFLIFYVVYTMWYGFAIFELFEGVGLSMKKSAKQEV